MGLTIKQENFCHAYIKTGNASEAYRMCYNCETMNKNSINRRAKELLDNSKITARSTQLQEKYIKKHNLSPERVLKEWAHLGFSDARTLLDETGNLLPVNKWPDSISQAVSSIKIRKEPHRGQDDPAEIIELKLWPKTNALDALSKHLGLFEKDNEQKQQILVLSDMDKKL